MLGALIIALVGDHDFNRYTLKLITLTALRSTATNILVRIAPAPGTLSAFIYTVDQRLSDAFRLHL
jgi:hypothetical protein